MSAQDTRKMFQDFERLARQEGREAVAARKEATGLLTPAMLEEYADKKKLTYKKALVLAYGKTGTVTYSPKQLHAFLEAREKRSKQFKKDSPGIPYSQLLRASRPEDKQRAKTVRSATLYQRKGNILFFRVAGNSKPYYRVQIRLEGWNEAVGKADNALVATQRVTSGLISIECACGRHQFWYRYLTTLGNFAIEPLEYDYPKIRNPKLTGCCCKHILKVLNELKTNRVQFILSKELDKERKKIGFRGESVKRVLSKKDLQIATSKQLSKSASRAFKKYKVEADKIKAELKARMENKVMQSALTDAVKAILQSSRAANVSPEAMLDTLANSFNVPRSMVDSIIRNNKL